MWSQTNKTIFSLLINFRMWFKGVVDVIDTFFDKRQITDTLEYFELTIDCAKSFYF